MEQNDNRPTKVRQGEPRLRTHNIWDVWRVVTDALAAEGIKSAYVGSQMSDAMPHLENFLVALDIVTFYPCYKDIEGDSWDLGCQLPKDHPGDCKGFEEPDLGECSRPGCGRPAIEGKPGYVGPLYCGPRCAFVDRENRANGGEL
jgi:hypothetical protein